MTPALVLLHGFTGSPASWDDVRARLPRAVRVLAPALPGHGVGFRGDSFEAEVDRLADAIAREVEPPSVLAGYSMGARVALALLVRHPTLFRSAVLIGVNPGIADPAERRARAEQEEEWARRLEEEGVVAFMEWWESIPLFASQAGLDPRTLARQRAIRLGHHAAGLARSLRVLGLAAMPDYLPRIADIRVPTTLVVGERDAKFRTLAEGVAARAPNARVCVVAGAGHNVVLENPDDIARLLEEELD